MNSVEIKLENCFGIGKLDYNFNFSVSSTFLIYAPNGSMKTSFAKTLELISKNDEKLVPNDMAYVERESKYQITVEGNPISTESILVVNAEDSNYDASKKISSFVASKDLKKKYDEIYLELDDKKNEYIKKLKQISKSSDCEGEFVETYRQSHKDTFFELLVSISDSLILNPTNYSFRYNDIFDKKGNVKKFLDKNQKLLSEYVNKYDELLKKSKFFKGSENSFGTYQANELLKSTQDNSYFDAGHKLRLSDEEEIKSAKELEDLLQSEISTIVNDDNLRKSFEKVDKAIGANTELRTFKSVIEKDNLLLVELENYESFRKKMWLNYISNLKEETKELASFYSSKKIEIEEIINEAKKEFEVWKVIIDTFNERFFVPFEISLVNQEDVVLKEETANLEFEYRDQNDAPVHKDKESLLSILSRGEKRAFFILQFLFDVESRKQLNQDTLLVLDDIADSFDYKNKYAIVEYLKELHQCPTFRLIILSHNFDFYRTVAKRLGINRNALLMTLKSDSREISFEQGQYINDIFNHFKSNFTGEKFFVSMIPLVRNLIEYMDGNTCENYLKLTSCLHIKSETDSIKCGEILSLIHAVFPSLSNRNIAFGEKLMKDLIYETADLIENENIENEILLENKIALSIAIRLKAEEYMIGKIPNATSLNITSNQTTELLRHFKSISNENSTIMVLERVNLMTPENIHLNAFMYEPLIDISIFHLIELYRSIKQLE
ncbi:MAG: hypothetical protein K8F60_04870 [Melioribacteraceae bacterium]|nr:hypothetical protein [Melioribacteraceae bacterium]